MTKRNFPLLKVAVAAIFIAGAAAFLFAGRMLPLKASASLSRTDVLIGDSMRYCLMVDARRDVSVEIPDLARYFEGFSIRNNKRTVEDIFGRRVYRYIYIIAKEDAGDFEVAPLEIRYKDKPGGDWRVQEVRGFDIRVRSVLGQEREYKKDIKIGSDMAAGPRGLAKESGDNGRTMTVDSVFDYRIKDAPRPKNILTLQDIVFLVLSGLAGLVALVALLTFIYDRVFRKKVPPVSIDIAALEKIKKLDPRHAVETSSPKDFCLVLSSVLKDYLRSRFSMEAREKTTREFLAELNGISGLADEYKKKVLEVLTLCDLVKYSGYASDESELSAGAAYAKTIVIDTRVVAAESVKKN